LSRINLLDITNDRGSHCTGETKRCPPTIDPALDIRDCSEWYRIDLWREGPSVCEQKSAIGKHGNTVVGEVFAADH